MADQSEHAFSRIGGHPAVDLLNTVDWRLDPQRRTEGLHSFAEVVAWCCGAGLVTQPEADRLYGHQRRRPRIAEEEWRCVLRLRDHVYDVVVGGDEASAEVIAAEYRQAVEHARLVRADDGSWGWGDSTLTLATPRRRIEVAPASRTPGLRRRWSSERSPYAGSQEPGVPSSSC